MMPTGLQTTGPDQTTNQTGPHASGWTTVRPAGLAAQTGPQTPDPATDQTGDEKKTDRTNAWALGLALAAVAAVWIGGCVWSFEEQRSFAAAKGFQVDWILPAVVDGLAFALAAVAFAAALDGRPAVGARIGTALAVAASAASNATWAWERTGGSSENGGDMVAVALAIGVPVAANLAFEVLLSEFRQQVLRRRGVPAPVKVPAPRPVRLLLSPIKSTKEWRRMVLDATDPKAAFDGAKAAAKADPASRTKRTRTQPAASDRTEQVTIPQTPGPDLQEADRTPTQTAALPDQTLAAGRTPRHADRTDDGPTPIESARTKRTADDTDALQQLHAEYGNQTPTLAQVQRTVGGGKSRAVRLRALFAAEQELAS